MDKPKLKLTGGDGNAFMIIGKAMSVAKKAGMEQEKIDKIRKEMMSGDYDHLIQVCLIHFDVE